MDAIFATIGTAGVGLILLAFFLIQTRKLTAEDMRYQLLNIAGSVLMLVSLYWDWNTPSVIIQCCWIAISLYAMFRITRERKHKQHSEGSHD